MADQVICPPASTPLYYDDVRLLRSTWWLFFASIARRLGLLSIPVPVSSGGTGVQTLPANGVLIGEGTDAVHGTLPGVLGQVLTSNGTGADPTFQDPASTISTLEGVCTVDLSPVTVTPTRPTGMFVTLDRDGRWKITASMEGRISSAGAGLVGKLVVNGVDQPGVMVLAISAVAAGDLTAMQTRSWYYDNTGSNVAELLCSVGAAAGNRDVYSDSSVISAEFLG